MDVYISTTPPGVWERKGRIKLKGDEHGDGAYKVAALRPHEDKASRARACSGCSPWQR